MIHTVPVFIFILVHCRSLEQMQKEVLCRFSLHAHAHLSLVSNHCARYFVSSGKRELT